MEFIKPINREDWVDADPANNIQGAIPPAKAFSQTMEEMVNVITASGQEPSGEDLHQFEKGIKQLVQLKVDEANLLAVSNTVYQRNVGDFFYTHNKAHGTRATGSLNGGYECNGDEFAYTDFTGDANPYSLLVNNNLPWVSYDNYTQILTRFGNCGYFGLDKTNKKFKVPTIKTAFLQAGTPGEFKEAGLPNITGEFASGANVSWADTRTEWKGAFQLGRARGGSGERRGMTQYFGNFNASWSNGTYGKSATVQPPAVTARVMVQLANEIDNATSVEKYLAQIKDAQKTALASIEAALNNLAGTAEQSLEDIKTDRSDSLTAIAAAKTETLAALQTLYDSSVEDIRLEIADLQKYVDETVEPLYDRLETVLDEADIKINNLTTLETTADADIASLTQLIADSESTVTTVTEKANAAATSAVAAKASEDAAKDYAEQAKASVDVALVDKTTESLTALETAKTAAVKAFDDNAAAKQTAVDASAAEASQSAAQAKQYRDEAEKIVSIPNATETVRGMAMVASAEDIVTGTDNTKFITPAGLQPAIAGKASAADLTSHSADTDNPHAVTKSQIGLGSVDNTSDADKPVSTAVQAALDDKAPLVSPAFTGTPTVPTQAVGNNSTRAASTEFVNKFQPSITALTATSGTIALAVNKIYSLAITGATTFTLPTPGNTNVFNQIKVMLKVTGTPTINWGTSNFFNKATPEISAGSYDVYFDYDNLLGAWVAGAMPKGVAE